jgi:hypothetical protein
VLDLQRINLREQAMSDSIGFNSSPSHLPFMDYTDDDCMVTSITRRSGFFISASGLKFETEVTDLVAPRDLNSDVKTAEPAHGLIAYNGHAGLGANQLLVLMADSGGQ